MSNQCIQRLRMNTILLPTQPPPTSTAPFSSRRTDIRDVLFPVDMRPLHFLDDKGTIRQTDFTHPKADVCGACTLNDVCGGLFELGDHYDLGELHPVFVSKDDIVRKVLAEPD